MNLIRRRWAMMDKMNSLINKPVKVMLSDYVWVSGVLDVDKDHINLWTNTDGVLRYSKKAIRRILPLRRFIDFRPNINKGDN